MGFRVIDAHGGLKTSYLAQASEVTITTTGNIDNLDFSNAATIRMNNASLVTIRGLKAGIAGQRVAVVSVGAGEVDLAHQNTNSTAANRLINFVTSGITPLAAGAGTATYEYDGTTARWRLVSHQQGAWITPTFAAGSFTGNGSLTWTVTSGEVTTFAYYLVGQKLTFIIEIVGTSTGGVANNKLLALLPNSWTIKFTSVSATIRYNDAGTGSVGGLMVALASGTQLGFQHMDLANWSNAAVTNTNVEGTVDVALN